MREVELPTASEAAAGAAALVASAPSPIKQKAPRKKRARKPEDNISSTTDAAVSLQASATEAPKAPAIASVSYQVSAPVSAPPAAPPATVTASVASAATDNKKAKPAGACSAVVNGAQPTGTNEEMDREQGTAKQADVPAGPPKVCYPIPLRQPAT